MTGRNRQLVPDNWSLVRERALTTGLCSEGWYSERSGAAGKECKGTVLIFFTFSLLIPAL